jgi:glucosamine-6-phosphate deaminase
VSSSLPGSAIQLHPLVTVIVDDSAGSRLAYRDYYRFSWENRLGFER